MAGDGNAEGVGLARHQRQAGQSRISGPRQRRRCRVDAGDEGDRHVQADHRSGRRPKTLGLVTLLKRTGAWAAIVAAVMIAATMDVQAAANYPARPITLIVPYPAGGGNDVIARLVAAKMSTSLGQPIVIENRGGAGSTIGTRDVARSAPDGYTLLIATSSLAINPALYPDVAYDPQKDFAAVGLIATSPNFVLVNPSSPIRSV